MEEIRYIIKHSGESLTQAIAYHCCNSFEDLGYESEEDAEWEIDCHFSDETDDYTIEPVSKFQFDEYKLKWE